MLAKALDFTAKRNWNQTFLQFTSPNYLSFEMNSNFENRRIGTEKWTYTGFMNTSKIYVQCFPELQNFAVQVVRARIHP